MQNRHNPPNVSKEIMNLESHYKFYTVLAFSARIEFSISYKKNARYKKNDINDVKRSCLYEKLLLTLRP